MIRNVGRPEAVVAIEQHVLAAADLKKLMRGAKVVSGKPVDVPAPISSPGPRHHFAGPGLVDSPVTPTTCGILRPGAGVACTTAIRLVTCAKCRARLVRAAGGRAPKKEG